jgi:outer membrane protein assembly factor BamB
MMKTLGVFPHNMTSAAPVAYGDYIYVTTGNGVDDTHKNVVAPKAPGIVCFDKNTGKMVWQDNSPGDQVLHGQWASVSVTEVKRPDGTVQPLVIAPLGDGWIYAYDAKTGKIVWKFDSNPKDAIYPQTRNELIATPVIVDNKMYIANGQDPSTGRVRPLLVRGHHQGRRREPRAAAEGGQGGAPGAPGSGGGGRRCGAGRRRRAGEAGRAGAEPQGQAEPEQRGRLALLLGRREQGREDQETERFHRSISTAAVHEGLCYVPDFSGYLHCFDAPPARSTGRPTSRPTCGARRWSSTARSTSATATATSTSSRPATSWRRSACRRCRRPCTAAR